MAKKIGQVAAVKEKVQRAKVVRVPVIAERDKNGKFLSGNLPQWDVRKNLPLGKKDFVDSASFFEFRSMVTRRSAQKFLDAADKIDARVAAFRKYGDDSTRKKAEKLARMQAACAALEKELGDEAVTATSE
jgi:hypothetical protein